MKRVLFIALLFTLAETASAQWVQKKKDGSYTVDTSVLCDNVNGYDGPTPVSITIKNDKIVSVVLLDNQETYKYVRKVEEQLLTKYVGLSVKEVLKNQPDGVTGATYSSKAVKKNIAVGLEEYLKNKK